MKRLLFPVIFLTSFSAVAQWTGPDVANKIYYTKGFVGIGDVPLYKFHLKGTDDKPLIFAETGDASLSFTRHFLELKAKTNFAQTPYIAWYTPIGLRQGYLGWRTDALGLTLENGFNFSINGGNVGIGTTDTKGYLLAVAGKTITEEVVVKLKANWPDYVFYPDYSLPPLDEVFAYVQQNKRLPDVPSAEEVKMNGINLNEMTSLLLKKVEELTLYLIEAERKHKSLLRRIQILETLREKEVEHN
jgi:hypothetical protein